MNRIDQIIDPLNAADYYVSGGTPPRTPRSQKGFLRIQEYLVRPESLVSVEQIRQIRQSELIIPSLLGYAFGLGQSLAFTREEIDNQGYALYLPKVAGVYNEFQTIVSPVPESTDLMERINNFFLNSKDYPDPFKRLLVNLGGFQMV